MRMGVDVFKTDFGEGTPADSVAHDGTTGAHLHNLYPLLYNDIVSQLTKEETGRSGLVWARSTYAGGQRHAAQWGGDPQCTYRAMAATIRGGLSIGMCGHPFWSHDIGGFAGQPTPELYVRWAQFGLFSPLARAHGRTTRLPWDYGEEVLRIFRDYVRLRYRLLPYIYTCACLAAESSLPIMRAMVLEFPEDPNTYGIDLQYMLGPELLVAPVYNESHRRPVYFPAGRWVDFWTHEVIQGPQTRFVEPPLDILPLYVRVNSLIPTIEPPDHVADGAFALVTIDAYLVESGRFEIRDTDGATIISCSFNGTCLDICLEGAKKTLGVRVIPLSGGPTVNEVHVNGASLPMAEKLEINTSADAGWTRSHDGEIHVMIRMD
jgi:alpha-D-xyloside xylohydrolase